MSDKLCWTTVPCHQLPLRSATYGGQVDQQLLASGTSMSRGSIPLNAFVRRQQQGRATALMPGLWAFQNLLVALYVKQDASLVASLSTLLPDVFHSTQKLESRQTFNLLLQKHLHIYVHLLSGFGSLCHILPSHAKQRFSKVVHLSFRCFLHSHLVASCGHSYSFLSFLLTLWLFLHRASGPS